jgi:hypothetical protein
VLTIAVESGDSLTAGIAAALANGGDLPDATVAGRRRADEEPR